MRAFGETIAPRSFHRSACAPPLRVHAAGSASAADRQAARLAAREVALLLSAARQTAATTLDGAAVHFDTAAAAVRVAAAGSTVRAVDLRARYGVALAVTRDSLAYDARGLGIGAANVTVILRARQAAETLVVSRLGRLRGGP